MKSKTPGFVVTIKGTSIIKLVITLFLLLFMSFSISGLLTSLKPEYRIKSKTVNTAASSMTGEVLYQFMAWENHSFLQVQHKGDAAPKWSSLMFKASTNVNLDDPRSLLGRELPGFSLFDGEILVAGEGTNYTNMPMESSPPADVLKAEQEASLQNTEEVNRDESEQSSENGPMSTNGKKVVYIYFSHTRESFLPYLKGVDDPNLAHHSKINVTEIGDRLKKQLQSQGIGTSVDKTDVMTELNKKGWTYGRSYDESREVVAAAMADNHDLSYLIDIHRDSRRKKYTTKEINGKQYAKLAFVIGAENPNYEKNLKLANELHKGLEKKYPGLSRGIIKKQGALTNGKFNQDLSGNALLIEFGGVDNTFEELYRSADALADVFSSNYWKAEKVSEPVKQPTGKE